MSKSREMLEQREKPKLEAEKDPVRIPIEMWNQIFKYSAARDLLNLSLVCKRFYETIGSLPEAMDKITLNLYSPKLTENESIFKSSRNYKNIKFQLFKNVSDAKICLKVVEKFGDALRDLELSLCQFTEEEFYKILEISKNNLEALSIQGSLFKEDSANATRPLKLSKLQRLEVRSSGHVAIQKVFDLMPDTLLEVIGTFWNWNDEMLLLRFLETQKNLKHLSLVPLQTNAFLKKINSATINFKLEKLDIGLLHQINSCKNFDNFLKSQAESLKELRLVGIAVNKHCDSLNNMPNLQSLELVKIGKAYEKYESGPSFNCPSLKSLIIDIDYGSDTTNFSFAKFLKRFATAQEIVLKMLTDSIMMKSIAKNQPNLKTLVIYKFHDKSFKSVKFKNLTKLEILKVQGYTVCQN